MMAKRVFVVLLFVVAVLLIATVGGSMAQEGTDRPHDATIDLAAPTLPDSQAILATQAVTVEKAAETPVVDPNGDLRISYVVTFTNDATTAVILDQITDTLPGEFEFRGMAAGSGVTGEPTDKEAPVIVWKGLFVVPGKDTLLMRYWIEGISTPGVYTNKVEGHISGGGIVSATADVTIQGTMFAVGKKASAENIAVGESVDYDVTITNTSNVTNVVAVVSDTLPTGLEYQAMAAGSDVTVDPVGITGTIVWTGPFTLPQGAELHLIYQVRAMTQGTLTNSVVGRDAGGKQFGPAQSEIIVGKNKVFLPHILLNYPEFIAPPDPLNEDFTEGVPDEWTAFVNWPELNANQWKWRGDGATWGRLDFLPGEELEQWSLNMYLGEGAQEWTNYRVEASVRAAKDYRHPLFGVWFRGTYEERTDNQGTSSGAIWSPFDPTKTRPICNISTPTCASSISSPCRATSIGSKPTSGTTSESTFKAPKSWFGLTVKSSRGLGQTWTKGTVGFGVYRGHGGIDNIRVTELDPLPTGLQMPAE